MRLYGDRAEMTIYLQLVENGYVVEFSTGEESDEANYRKSVYEFGPDELDTLQSVLFDIIEFLGAGGSRYDKKRIRVGFEPGDKYEAPQGPVQSGKRKGKKSAI